MAMTETTDTRADSTRQQILRAAARQFARLPYHQVGLDDVLAEAELTKGAMYFHFRSKHALALVIIEDQITRSHDAITDLLARKFSGLETLIDFSYQLAVRDISEDISRAALHLVESIGRIDGLQAKLHREWIDNLTVAENLGFWSRYLGGREAMPAALAAVRAQTTRGTFNSSCLWKSPNNFPSFSPTSRACSRTSATNWPRRKSTSSP